MSMITDSNCHMAVCYNRWSGINASMISDDASQGVAPIYHTVQSLYELMSSKSKQSPNKIVPSSPAKKNASSNDSGTASTTEHLIKLLLIGDSGKKEIDAT